MSEELYLVSNLLYDKKFVPIVAGKIQPDDFDDRFLGDIYAELLQEKDVIGISKDLDVKPEKIMEIACVCGIGSAFAVRTYGQYIFERNKNRKLKEIANAEQIDTNKLIEVNTKKFDEELPQDESEAYVKMVEDVYSGKPDLLTMHTGFYNVDDKIGGFRKSEAIFIGGRPASGKTTFAINVAYNMARNHQKVLFCSLEMGARELHERLVKHITQISGYKGKTDEEIQKIIKTSKAIKARLPLTIYDKSGMKIEDIFAKTLDLKPDVVFIDHLAILKSAQRFKSRYEEVSYLSAKIKELARQFDIPVICLCQLNRNLEGRDIKAPTLSDIRDSGSVEQDGDIIGFIYRPEYHLMQQEPDNEKQHIEWEEKLRAVKGKAKFIIAKNRRGFTGSFLFGFKGETYSFFEL